MNQEGPDLSDAEIDRVCDGYTQAAAKIRYLRSLGFTVARKPNGRPLVSRKNFETVLGGGRLDHTGAQEPAWSR